MNKSEEYRRLINSGDIDILCDLIRQGDDPFWSSAAIRRINDENILMEFITGPFSIDVCEQIEKITGVSICRYLDRTGMVGKALPYIQKAEPGYSGEYKRKTLEEFHKRKYGFYLGENGPYLDDYQLERQVYKSDLDEAYKNVSYDDVVHRLKYIIDKGIDGSDEMSYISSQDNHDEYIALLMEYEAWSLEKLSSMDLLMKGDII